MSVMKSFDRCALLGAICAGLFTMGSTIANAQSVILVPLHQPTIQQALNRARAGTTIRVAPGVYRENIFWPTVDGIRVVSDAGSAVTTIDGGGLARVVQFPVGLTRATRLEGFTVTNGRDRDGAGIRVLSSPTIRLNVITNNTADATSQNEGAGVHVSQGSPLIERNVISNNIAMGGLNAFGGGIFVRAGAAPAVIGNRIVGNTADGAVTAMGGGVYLDDMLPATADLISNVIAANGCVSIGTAEGGGIAIAGGPAQIQHCTVADNDVRGATARGAGIFFGPSARPGSVVQNTIVARNLAGGGIVVAGGQPTLDDNDVWSNTGGDYIGVNKGPNDVSVDPRFAGSADYHLTASSPLIDAGRNTPVAGRWPFDYDGDVRRLDGDLDGRPTRVDIGADEVSNVGLSTASVALLGGRLVIGTTGPAGYSHVTAFSLTGGRLLAEPFGFVLLGTPFAVLGQGSVPGVVNVPVPNVPSLGGVELFTQAVVFKTAGGLAGNATNRERVRLEPPGAGIVEAFVDKAKLDANATTANWTEPGRSGLFATYGFGGDGTDGDLTLSGSLTLDSNTRTPGADGVVEWNFRDLVIQSSGQLTLTGPRTIRLNVLRNCTISGSIFANGRNGLNAPPGTAVAIGTIVGGPGGPGGGTGGDSNTRPTNPLGALPLNLRGKPGYPRSTTDCNALNKSENFALIVFQINCGGGAGGNRGLPSGLILRSGCTGNGGGHAQAGFRTDFACSNAGAFGSSFGDVWVLASGVGEIAMPSAGCGGGAGGNAAVSTTSPSPSADIVAGSGGGAGGGFEIETLGSLLVTSSARVLAQGGSGGAGHTTLVGSTTVRAGYGAGGAGGSIWLSGASTQVDAGAVIDARGGTGNPMPPTPTLTGDGGDGYVIIRDLGGNPQVTATPTPPLVTQRQLFAPPSNGKSVAVSTFYDGLTANPAWSFNANNPQTGNAVPGGDLTFSNPPSAGQTVRILFQGAPELNGQPDPNPANWFPVNGFTPDINSIRIRGGLRFIRFRIEFDTGPVTKGAPVPNQITVQQLRMGL